MLTKNEIYLKRTRGVGRISRDACIGLGLAGPIGRAAGWNYDVRKMFPYGGYDTFDFDVPVGLPRPSRKKWSADSTQWICFGSANARYNCSSSCLGPCSSLVLCTKILGVPQVFR